MRRILVTGAAGQIGSKLVPALREIYWVTQSINSSTRLYHEAFGKAWYPTKDAKIQLPTGVAAFPSENTVPIREWSERSYHV